MKTNKKPRPLYKLMELCLSKKLFFISGLCAFPSNLNEYGQITSEEKTILKEYFATLLPQKHYKWEPGLWEPRKKWLKKHIETTKTEFFKQHLGRKVEVLHGGFGARGADGQIGRLTTQAKALSYGGLRGKLYAGELRDIEAPVYIYNKSQAWGLCKGYELQLIPTRWERLKSFAKDLFGLSPR